MFKNCLIFALFYIFYVLTSSLRDYGSFNLTVTKYELCKGPKRKECCETYVQLNNDSTMSYDLFVKENVTPTKGKIVAMSNGKEFLRLQMKKPCDHLFMRPLFHSLMNVTKNCVILKGRYTFKLDMKEVANKYYNGSFLFGNWTFKSFFYTDECNFSCTVVSVELSPKNATTRHN